MKQRWVVVTGDDFGFSHGVNQAIIQAHERGILTAASLMVNGEAAEEAVELARQHPRLAVGLHLVLTCGKAVLPPLNIPHLVGRDGRFSDHLSGAGFRYQCHGPARREIQREIRAQLEKFRQTGLSLSHVDGHEHMHMVPIVLNTLTHLAGEFRIRAGRIPSEEFGVALRTDRSHFLEKAGLSLVFGMLVPYAQRRFRSAGIRFSERVYGLLQTGRMTEDYWLKLIPQIRADRVEIYAHPTLDSVVSPKGEGRAQLEALLSPRVRELLSAHGFRLATFQELN